MPAAIETARALGAGIDPGVEPRRLADAVGRTLASSVLADHDLPSFASSAMDGFAVRSADTAVGLEPLRIIDESRAGRPATAIVRPGEAVRIATGAAMPAGADAIVPYEQAVEADGTLTCAGPAAEGRFVRPVGTDVRAGAVLASAGRRLEARQLAVLAGAGVRTVSVRRSPKVSLLLTGDEVVRAEQIDGPLPAGHVHDVNGVVVPALLEEWGATLVERVYVPDDRAATVAALADARGDLVVVCGGISVGPHDHVRPALAQLGARPDLFRIALQPGKPTWLGALPATPDGGPERPVFGLPGNPASVFVTATLLVRAAIDAALGVPPRPPLRARLAEDATGLPGRTAVRRAGLAVGPEGTLVATVLAGQESHLLGSLSAANALVVVPADATLPAGSLVDVVPLGPLGDEPGSGTHPDEAIGDDPAR